MDEETKVYNGIKVGYIRVSTDEQNPARQEALMEELGVEKVFPEKISGKNTDRPELKKMMAFLREGDTLIVESFSRFARNARDLLNLVEELRIKGVKFVSKKENIDTSTATGRFLLTVLAAISQLERESILERQKEGIAIAKAAGKYTGRKRKEINNFDKVYKDWKNGSITATKAYEKLGISKKTFYNRVREMEAR